MASMMDALRNAKKTADELPPSEEKPGPTELGQDAIASVLPPDAPEPSLKKRGRPKKAPEPQVQPEQGVEEVRSSIEPTYFKGKVSKVSLGRTLNLGQFEGVRIDLEYQVEEGDHRAAFDYLRSEMREIEKYFKEDK